MSHSLLLSILLSLVVTPALAAKDEHAGHHAAPAAASANADALSEATVKKNDKTAGKLTLAHGPLKNLNMSPMTMSFKVKDAAVLAPLKVGDKIVFVAEDVGGELFASKISKAK